MDSKFTLNGVLTIAHQPISNVRPKLRPSGLILTLVGLVTALLKACEEALGPDFAVLSQLLTERRMADKAKADAETQAEAYENAEVQAQLPTSLASAAATPPTDSSFIDDTATD